MPLDDSWKNKGLCRSVDPEIFWPNGVTGTEAEKIEAAKRICRACPVMKTCLRWAVEHRQYYGIWGAQTEEERREERKKTQTRYRGRFVSKKTLDKAEATV